MDRPVAKGAAETVVSTLLICLLAALAPDQADGLATHSSALPWATVTYALQRPPLDSDEAVLLERIAAWDAAFDVARYAVPIATPTAGGDVAGQLARIGRFAAAIGQERLVVVTPPVGTAGWETSNNVGWLPLGGRPQRVATPRDTWLEALTSSAAGTVALAMEGLAAEPTPEQFGEQIDALLAACRARDKHAEVWLPANWAMAADASPLLAALTPERVLALLRVVWLDVEPELPTPSLALAAEDDVPVPASGGVAPAPATGEAPVPADSEIAVQPTAMQSEEAMIERLGPLRDRTPEGTGAVDLVDSPRQPLARLDTARSYLGAAREAGFGHLVIRGRLDTPQAPLWRELLLEIRSGAGNGG